MGAENSTMYGCLEQEFNRLTQEKKQRIHLGQILQLKLPSSPWSLDPSHLGVLFALDRDKKGKVSLSDLYALVELSQQRIRCYQLYEFQMQMQGFCTLQMWQYLAAHGEELLTAWLMKLIKSAGKTRRFAIGQEEIFIHEESVRLLFNMCHVEEAQGVQFAEYLTVLQQAGENEGLMDIEDAEQDEWVPMSIVHILLASIVQGISKVMQEICAHEDAGHA